MSEERVKFVFFIHFHLCSVSTVLHHIWTFGIVWCFDYRCLWLPHSKCPTDRRQCVLKGFSYNRYTEGALSIATSRRVDCFMTALVLTAIAASNPKGDTVVEWKKQTNTSGRRWSDTETRIYLFMHLFVFKCFLCVFMEVLPYLTYSPSKIILR